MKTKQKDIKMCGVRDISDFDFDIPKENLSLFRDYIVDRYNIHLLKGYYNKTDLYSNCKYADAFKRYKFCNMRREHDRCSKWLIDNISNNKNLSFKHKIYKSICFRIYNNVHTAELIGLADAPITSSAITFIKYEEKVEKLTPPIGNSYYKYFTDAYGTAGMKAGIKHTFPHRQLSVCPVLLARKLYSENFAEKLIKAESQKDVFDLLMSINGVSTFLAYQLFVDLTYIEEFQFSENEFVVAGPGCSFGIELLFGKENRKNIPFKDEEILFWLRDHLLYKFEEAGCPIDLDNLFIDVPEYDRCLNVMMLENCLCEFQKFYRIVHFGKWTRKYKPFKE